MCISTFPDRYSDVSLCLCLEYMVPHKHFHFSGIIPNKTTPTFSLIPSLWSSCFSLSSPSLPAVPPLLPCVCGCFRAWQEAKSEGLNLIKYSADIDFSESLDSPSLPPSCFPFLHPLPRISHFCSARCSHKLKVVWCSHALAHAGITLTDEPRTYAHGGIIN